MTRAEDHSPFIMHTTRQLPAFALLASLLAVTAFAADNPVKLRMSVVDPLIPTLTASLGNFAREGLDVTFVKVESVSSEDYLMQEPLVNGRLDVSCHWFQQVAFGVRHNFPVRAVLLINDAPGIKILVANRVKDQIRSAADFKGRQVAEGAGYATKSLLVKFLVRQAGLARDSYEAVLPEVENRRENVINGLRHGGVDVAAFMEPLTSAIEATGLVSTLYDLSDRAGTVRAFGDVWPSHSVFLSVKFIEENPATVQHLVNAFVRTLRFVNSHTAEQIAEKLPASYFAGKDRAAEITRIARTLPSIAQGDYTFPLSAVKMALATIETSLFDESIEGRFRRQSENPNVRAEDLFTNRFAEQAMKEIR